MSAESCLVIQGTCDVCRHVSDGARTSRADEWTAGWRPGARGFTLIELMVAIGILALLMRLAAPSFESVFLSNRLASYANAFTASAQLARSEAIKRNTPITLCRSADGVTCSSSGGWEQGWIVRCASSDGNVCNSSGTSQVVFQVQQALNGNYRFTGDTYSLAFQATGLSASTASLTLCQALPSPGRQERTIQVLSTGRVSVATTKTGNCSA